MQFIDTHAHIYAKEFEGDIEEVLLRCEQTGVDRIYMPNINSNSIEPMLAMESRDPDKYIATMGLHPCYVKADFEKELAIVENWLGKRPFVAIGEIGIDLYWDKTFFEQQKQAFLLQCQWAKRYNVPIIIHARDSLNEIFELMDSIADDTLRGVFHCFSGDLEQAQRALGYGFYLGIGGVATFKNGGLDKVLPHLSLDKIVLETDAPYLAPVPHRGKRNESSYVPLVAEKLSELTGKSLIQVAKITSENALELFKDQLT